MTVLQTETMTAAEVIEAIQATCRQNNLDPNEVGVVFAHAAGDYWRSTVADAITEAEYDAVQYSEYHRQLVIDSDNDRNNPRQIVIVLK